MLKLVRLNALAEFAPRGHQFCVLVFIDESGDPGFKTQRGSTPAFTAALVAFQEVEQARLTQNAIAATAKRLRIFPEFKFSKCRPEVRDTFFTAVMPFGFRVRAIVVRKEKIYSNRLRSDKESFYAFFVKSMLKFDDGLLQEARIIMTDRDGKAAGRYKTSEAAASKLKALLERRGPGGES